MWWNSKPRQTPNAVLQFDEDALNWNDLHSGGVVAIGATGSGKTSTMAQLATSMLSQQWKQPDGSTDGCSMVVCCAKTTEAEHFMSICEKANCLEDVCHIRPGCSYTLDILQWELAREGGSPQSVTQQLTMLNDVMLRSSSNGQGDEPFWANLFYETLLNAIELVFLSGGGSLPLVNKVILSAPQSPEQAASPEWAKGTVCGKLLQRASVMVNTPVLERRLERVLDYFLENWPAIGEKARGAALSQTGSILSKFCVEPFSDLLCSGTTNLPPDSVFTDPRRKIILLDLPVLRYGDAGRFLQILWTMNTESAVLRRDVRKYPRTVVIWRDEAHLLCHSEWSSRVLSVGRSQKCISVSMFQTMPGLIAAFGGTQKADLEAKSFITNHPVKFAYASSCKDSMEYLAELIGKDRKLFFGGGHQQRSDDPLDDVLGVGSPAGLHWNEQLDYAYPPAGFMRLRTGGEQHQNKVDAIWFQQGRQFANGANFRKVTFTQGS